MRYKQEVYDNALAWIFDHCDCAGGIKDYVLALKSLRITNEELFHEISVNCGYTEEEIKELFEECGIY